MKRLFVDTMVLAYAIGGESEHRAPCRAIVAAVAAGEVELTVSAEAIQELLFHRLRRTDRVAAVKQCRAVAAMCVLLPVDADVVDGMFDVVQRFGIRGRDAIHAATALANGFGRIVSTDLAFDRVDGLERIDPQRAVAG